MIIRKVLFFAGSRVCSSYWMPTIDPKVINETHPAYNCAMGSVIDRQMLSNYVQSVIVNSRQ